MMRLLLLAGTAEARQLAAALGSERRVSVIASLAGATRSPRPLGVATRIGGFGGAEGFADWLKRERIDAVMDATHPFAARISHRTAEVCDALGLSYVQFLRPPWMPVDGDRWHFLNDESDAARFIPAGARVFLATGRQGLERFANLEGRELVCRQIDTPDRAFPFPNGHFMVGAPPFDVEDEEVLFRRLGIDWLVAKNAGGSASRAKLDAARHLHLPVAMIRRPLQPEGPKLQTVAAALGWVRRRL
ncbi:precorrin-6A/cobalt-precorrin-6A reductase [Tranquillimonas rosea]|uniref:Precorrin-6A/cobalt-precorrin-6A reductase n=1 Tax=Tranquillimonas rosea TaxID=641238 RepID=A0A1H9THM0_9RHOB|nr:cobalt-precorrin-6A reductase [Tranquillimonas rosea]SER96618.1 precorrin-6A/cobalt-precorrin-6A reductase [Tranquillimonas rosea]